MGSSNNSRPRRNPHPGIYIKEEMEERGMKQKDLANEIGCSESTVSQLLSGKLAISVPMARRLFKVFGVSAEFWLNSENRYRLQLSEDSPAQNDVVSKECSSRSQIVLNIPSNLHDSLIKCAEQEGISTEDFCISLIENHLYFRKSMEIYEQISFTLEEITKNLNAQITFSGETITREKEYNAIFKIPAA